MNKPTVATKQKLLEVRRNTYRHPLFRRCENCKHFWPYSGNCQAIEIRGKIQFMKVNPAGVCDLFEGQPPVEPTE